MRFLAKKLKEFMLFDFVLSRHLFSAAVLLSANFFWLLKAKKKAVDLWLHLHRANYTTYASKVAERRISNLLSAPTSKVVSSIFQDHIHGVSATNETVRKLLGHRILVVKSPSAKEKGVIFLDYNYVFPLFLKFFDIGEVSRKYRLVLEPSWSGYCDLDILCMTTVPDKVIVQAGEPRDFQLLNKIHSNLLPINTAANWWVDYRIMRPLEVEKVNDIIMVASWSNFKRHYRFFEAISKAKSLGKELRVALVGYGTELSKDAILKQAAHFNVETQITIFENLTPEEVNIQYNKSKVNILWSRKEGFNRAIIEGMFAGIPCIVREGFNYGYEQPYINSSTGMYATEADLPTKLIEVVSRFEDFAPRDWVLKNMSVPIATQLVNEQLKQIAKQAGEEWTVDIVPKTCHLNTMEYWIPENKTTFLNDYRFLKYQLVSLKN